MSKSGHIKGLDKLIKDLKALGDEGEQVLAGVTEVTARDIEANAKIYAPKDTGKLAQSIKALEISKLTWKVLANATGLAPYAAYMEFGTGGLVDVPAELTDMAIKFKGKGVKRIDLRPQPFLYPALLKGRKNYKKDLEAELKAMTKKI